MNNFKCMWENLWVIKIKNVEHTSDYVKAFNKYKKLLKNGMFYIIIRIFSH